MEKLYGSAFVAVVVVLLMTACSDTGMAPEAQEERHAASWIAVRGPMGDQLQSRLDGLAAGVAAAAQDATVRDELFLAFQMSRKAEGKVHLHAVAGPGTGLGQRLAARFGLVGGLETAFAGLSPLDFYAGRHEDRVAWRPGAATVAVVAVADPDQRSAIAHFSDGRTQRVSGPGDVRADVLLLIHPTEQTLQSTVECDPATSVEPCPGEGGGGGVSASTSVHRFEVYVGDWWGSAEVEFRGEGFCGSSHLASGTFRKTGVTPGGPHLGGVMISGWSPAQCAGDGRVHVELWETDPISHDYYGTAQWYQNEHGGEKHFIYGALNGWAEVVWTMP